MGVFMHRPFGRAAALTLAAAMLLGAPSALAAQVREILHVQFRVPGMGVGMPLGKFDQFAEKTSPYKIVKRHGPGSLEGKCRKVRHLNETSLRHLRIFVHKQALGASPRGQAHVAAACEIGRAHV